MALAPYFSRVSDAVGSVTSVSGPELVALLGETVVQVDFAPATEEQPWTPGVALLGNMLGRLYPTVGATGPAGAVASFTDGARRSNPDIDIRTEPATGRTFTIRFGDTAPADVSVTADGWRVYVDQAPDSTARPQVLTTLAAACLAAAELFRTVFADVLGPRGRRGRQPGAIDLISGDPDRPAPAADLDDLELPPMHLAGAGAVGQACALALAASGARGQLTVVDPEPLELTNVQRYVLSTPGDVGTLKTALIARNLEPRGWQVERVSTAWGADARSAPQQAVVLVALDSARDRLGVAAGMHGRIYNAWTQPADLGWTRHENYGVDPCLACIYYPTGPRPSDDELIAAALHQDRLRVLSYLVTGLPVGLALPQIVPVADLTPPLDASRWLQVPLMTDLVDAGLVDRAQQQPWASRTVGELYTAGICGGGLLYPNRSELPAEVIVPLAHQSALAGVMLALQPIVAAVPQLAQARFDAVEGRLDLQQGLPQLLARPRQRTAHCLCNDPAFEMACRAAS
jgi:hypothetical protein